MDPRLRPTASCEAEVAATGVGEARTHLTARRYDRAAEALAGALGRCHDDTCRRTIRPGLVALLECWAGAAEGEGNLERIVLLRRVAVTLAPTLDHRAALVRALLLTGRLTAARTELAELGRDSGPRARSLRQALERALAPLAKAEQAARALAPPQREAAEAEVERAAAELAAGRAAAAEARLRAAMKHAEDPRGLLLLAEALAQLGRPREALQARSRALGLAEERGGGPVEPRPLDGRLTAVIAFGPDGRQLFAASASGEIQAWDVRSGEVTGTLGGGEGSRAVDEHGRYAATWDRGATVQVQALANGQRVSALTVEQGIASVAFEAQGRHVAVWGGGGMLGAVWVKVFTLPAGQALASPNLEDSRELTAVAFDPGTGHLVTLAEDGTVQRFSLTDGKRIQTLRLAPPPTEPPRLDPQGRHLAAGAGDGTAWLWELATGKRVQTLAGHDGQVTAVAFDRTGRLLATGGLSTVKVWALPAGTLVHTFAAGPGFVDALTFDPKGQVLAARGEDEAVRLYDLTAGRLLRTLSGRGAPVTGLAIDAARRVLAVADQERGIRLWPLSGGAPGPRLAGHAASVWSVAADPRGRYLASGSQDRTLRLWSLPGGAPVATAAGHGADLRSVAFDPQGQFVASGSDDRTVKLWALPGGALLQTLAGHGHDVNTVAFDPRGRYLASGSHDATVRLWELPAGTLRQTVADHADHVTAVTFDASGEHLASGSWDGTVKLRELSAGSLRLLRSLDAHEGGVNAVAFAPGGKVLATAGAATVKLWALPAGTPLRTLEGHADAVTSLAFDPAGRFLTSGSDDGTVKLWALPAGDLLATIVTPGSGEWVVTTPDGYLDGSEGGRRALRYGRAGTGWPWALGWPRYGVPGLLGRLVEGDGDFRLAALNRLLAGSRRGE
jgi:WD40 repeat protein